MTVFIDNADIYWLSCYGTHTILSTKETPSNIGVLRFVSTGSKYQKRGNYDFWNAKAA